MDVAMFQDTMHWAHDQLRWMGDGLMSFTNSDRNQPNYRHVPLHTFGLVWRNRDHDTWSSRLLAQEDESSAGEPICPALVAPYHSATAGSNALGNAQSRWGRCSLQRQVQQGNSDGCWVWWLSGELDSHPGPGRDAADANPLCRRLQLWSSRRSALVDDESAPKWMGEHDGTSRRVITAHLSVTASGRQRKRWRHLSHRWLLRAWSDSAFAPQPPRCRLPNPLTMRITTMCPSAVNYSWATFNQ